MEFCDGMLLAALVFLASLIAVEIARSAAIIGITLGIAAGHFLGLAPLEWVRPIDGFGGLSLLFLSPRIEPLWCAVVLLLVLMYFAHVGASHAILPAFVLGLILSPIFHENRALQRKLRVVALAFIPPSSTRTTPSRRWAARSSPNCSAWSRTSAGRRPGGARRSDGGAGAHTTR